MHGSGHRRLLKNSFFSNLLVWRSRNNLHKSVALPCDTPPLIPALLPEGEGSF
jgi:hypothetical protein